MDFVSGWSDIGYNFLVGEDGTTYEGRGWYNLGAHAGGYNTGSVGICVIGDFTSRVPNAAAQSRVQALMRCGVSSVCRSLYCLKDTLYVFFFQGLMPSSYNMGGHRDVGATACPGDSFYPVIQGWPNYTPNP